MKTEQVSMRQEQEIYRPEKGRPKVVRQKRPGDVQKVQTQEAQTQEAQTQKMEKLMDLMKELGGNGFFGKLLIKYDAGHIVLVRKTQYIRPSAQHER